MIIIDEASTIYENKIDCSLCPHNTNPEMSNCCGIIPFPLKFLEANKPLFKADGELKTDGQQAVILTKDLLCVFYDREKNRCNIYEKRPKVCRDYGNIDKLKCPYFKRSGARRSPASEKVTRREMDAMVDRAMGKSK